MGTCRQIAHYNIADSVRKIGSQIQQILDYLKIEITGLFASFPIR